MSERPKEIDTIDKMVLVIESASLAKQHVVKEYGIGEDLAFNIYGWVKNELCIIAQMESQHMWGDPFERFKKLANAACIIRKGWHIDEFTLVAEGYCSTDAEKTKGIPLKEAFIHSDSVSECLTFTHVSQHETLIVTKPYKLDWPRKVNFAENIYYPGQTVLRRKDGLIPTMLLEVLQINADKEPIEDIDSYYTALGEGLIEEGFLAQWL